MRIDRNVKGALQDAGWGEEYGKAYVVFDGQYGSTGKGVAASVLAEAIGYRLDAVITSAGPNSGHTAWHNGAPFVTHQLPVASVYMHKTGLHAHECHLNAGAVIDLGKLQAEIGSMLPEGVLVTVHPNAAVIWASDKEKDRDAIAAIASTGQGVGPALARKVLRTEPMATMGQLEARVPEYCGGGMWVHASTFPARRVLVETAQGWSLGINQPFYPNVTSRECSVSQALSDAGMSPRDLGRSMVCLRTFPIRVGNVGDASSGGAYPDQLEIDFDTIGQQQEYTSTTNRPRRIFTWSWDQFDAMLLANKPDDLFLNFVNYLPEMAQLPFCHRVARRWEGLLGRKPGVFLAGYGPKVEDVRLVQ